MTLTPVTMEQFWLAVKTTTRNVHPRIVGQYPYTSSFRFIDYGADGEFGRIERDAGEQFPSIERHYMWK